MASNGYHDNNGHRSSAADGGEDQHGEVIDLRSYGHNLDNKHNGFIISRDDDGGDSDQERDSIEEDNGQGNNYTCGGTGSNSSGGVGSLGETAAIAGNAVAANNENEAARNGGSSEEDMDVDEDDVEIEVGGFEQDLKNGSDETDLYIRGSLSSDDINTTEEKDVGTEKDVLCCEDNTHGLDTSKKIEDTATGKAPFVVEQSQEGLSYTPPQELEPEKGELGVWEGIYSQALTGKDCEGVKDDGVTDGQRFDGHIDQTHSCAYTTDQITGISNLLVASTTVGGGSQSGASCGDGSSGGEGQYHSIAISVVKEGNSSSSSTCVPPEPVSEGQQQPPQPQQQQQGEGFCEGSRVATLATEPQEQECVLVVSAAANGTSSSALTQQPTTHTANSKPHECEDYGTASIEDTSSRAPPPASDTTDSDSEKQEEEKEQEQEDSFIGKRSSSAETLELVDRSLTPPPAQAITPSPTDPLPPNTTARINTGLTQGLTDNFVDYLSARIMERSNSEEEKRDAEKLSDVEVVDTACHGEDLAETGSSGLEPASAAAPQEESDNCCTNASEACSLETAVSPGMSATGKAGEEDKEKEDEKDVDTADNAEGETKDEMSKDEQGMMDDEAGAACGQESSSVTDEPSSATLEINTAELISLDKDIDAADKDVSDEKGPTQEEPEEEFCLPRQPCTRSVQLVEFMEKPCEEQDEQQVTVAQIEAEPCAINPSAPDDSDKDEDQDKEEEGEVVAVPSDTVQGYNDPLEEEDSEDEGVKPGEVQEERHESPVQLMGEPLEEEEMEEESPPEPEESTTEGLDGFEPQPPADQRTEEPTLLDFSEPTPVEEQEQQEEKVPAFMDEAMVETEEEKGRVDDAEEKESDEEVNTFIEHPSPNAEEEEEQQVPEETKSQTVAFSEEAPTPSVEIVHADDKVDDGIESVQSISNIKTRFQGHDDRPPMPGDRSYSKSATPANGHVNGDHSPPEVVNRSESQEEILERELPPANLARSMASKFRDMESDGPVERKPVRKITPPREEVERDVTYVRESIDRDPNIVRSDASAEKEDERPPPSFTKNMLAKFKEMEDTTNPPPSPARSAISPTKRTALSHQQFASHTNIRASPDEGIADTEPSTNGHRSEVIREADKNETEELPERGFTKSLLAQWRQIEQTAPAESAKSLAPRQTTPGKAAPYRQASPSNAQNEDGPRDVVREGDNNEEEFLPPPSYTKNMLAKFQTLQDESATNQSASSSKKQFKWEVREAKPLWGGVPSREQLTPEAVNGQENGNVFSSDEEEEYVDEIDLECDEHGNPLYPINHPRHPDNVRRHHEKKRSSKTQREVIKSNESGEPEEELPAPQTTKRLLSQFKSMEDVTAPLPTPERVARQQKVVRESISAHPVRQVSVTSEEREQPDGTDNFDHNTQPEHHYEDGGEFENIPVHREDVVRETDIDDGGDLPEQGTTRNLLAKFQSLQAV